MGVVSDGYRSAAMLFDHEVRAPAAWELEYAVVEDEPARIRIGYDRATARRIVRDAWACGESGDLVHRVTNLVGRGASREQAARIA